MGLTAPVVPMVDQSWPFRDLSWLFRDHSRLAFSIQAEAGGTAIAIGGTAIPGVVGGVIADPIGAERDCFAPHFEGRSIPALPAKLGNCDELLDCSLGHCHPQGSDDDD